MDKKQALKEISENGRNVVAEEYVNEMLQPFGLTAKDLGLSAVPVSKFVRLNYLPEDADKKAIAVSTVADRLCKKLTGVEVYSTMLGTGSYAADITNKAVAEIEKTL